MAYSKIVRGFIEQQFDDEGRCTAQQFIPDETASIDRRDEDDDLIIDPHVEANEIFFPYDMVQPKPS